MLMGKPLAWWPVQRDEVDPTGGGCVNGSGLQPISCELTMLSQLGKQQSRVSTHTSIVHKASYSEEYTENYQYLLCKEESCLYSLFYLLLSVTLFLRAFMSVVYACYV
jgi:hypothetical protein